MSRQTPEENWRNGPLGIRWSPELISSMTFAAGILLIARLGLWVPLPGVDLPELTRLLTASGHWWQPYTPLGSLAKVSVFALGLWPFVYAWAICELLRGTASQKVYARWRRLLTLLIAIGMSLHVASQITAITHLVVDPGFMFSISTAVTLTCGTMLLVWLGEQITKTGLCDGIWLIIAVDFIAGIPARVWMIWNMVNWGALGLGTAIVIGALLLVTVCLVVFVESAKRSVEARRDAGAPVQHTGGTYLPVDFATVLPTVFSGLLLFSTTSGFALLYPWLGDTAYLGLVYFGLGQPMYLLSYCVLIVVMTFVMAALIAPRYAASGTKPDDNRNSEQEVRAENRRGLDQSVIRLAAITAVYLLIVFLLPELGLKLAAVTLPLSGVSILIVVIVLLDIFHRAGARWGA